MKHPHRVFFSRHSPLMGKCVCPVDSGGDYDEDGGGDENNGIRAASGEQHKVEILKDAISKLFGLDDINVNENNFDSSDLLKSIGSNLTTQSEENRRQKLSQISFFCTGVSN